MESYFTNIKSTKQTENSEVFDPAFMRNIGKSSSVRYANVPHPGIFKRSPSLHFYNHQRSLDSSSRSSISRNSASLAEDPDLSLYSISITNLNDIQDASSQIPKRKITPRSQSLCETSNLRHPINEEDAIQSLKRFIKLFSYYTNHQLGINPEIDNSTIRAQVTASLDRNNKLSKSITHEKRKNYFETARQQLEKNIEQQRGLASTRPTCFPTSTKARFGMGVATTVASVLVAQAVPAIPFVGSGAAIGITFGHAIYLYIKGHMARKDIQKIMPYLSNDPDLINMIASLLTLNAVRKISNILKTKGINYFFDPKTIIRVYDSLTGQCNNTSNAHNLGNLDVEIQLVKKTAEKDATSLIANLTQQAKKAVQSNLIIENLLPRFFCNPEFTQFPEFEHKLETLILWSAALHETRMKEKKGKHFVADIAFANLLSGIREKSMEEMFARPDRYTEQSQSPTVESRELGSNSSLRSSYGM